MKSWFKRKSLPDTIRHDQARILTAYNNFFMSEAYKTLRTNVMFSLTDQETSNVVLVTSSMPGEGKSTTSVNLAISLSQDGKKTLLIDCDMRKPRISRLLRLSSSLGLSNVLLQPERIDEAIARVEKLNLSVLTAGVIPPNPSELLGSKRMALLLQHLREQYEYIILDAPPVNIVTDAAVLSRFTDGVIVVVRSGQSERNAVLAAIEQLRYARAKILGVVLNGAEQKHSTYGKYYKNSYYYESAPENRDEEQKNEASAAEAEIPEERFPDKSAETAKEQTDCDD